MISQITPAGIRPARRARSTAASVWPTRSSTPAAAGLEREHVAGLDELARAGLGSIATWIVRARSAAEIPVLTPERASIETVKAVSKADSFLAAIRSRPSSSQRSPVSARQISPRPSLAMKLIASGVTNWAAMVRSPSFSRVSSSQTTTILPWRMSSIASSIEAKVAGVALIGCRPTSFSTYLASTSTSRLTIAPGPTRPRLVRCRVSGIRETVKDASSMSATVSETPSTATEPFADHVAQHVGRGAHLHAAREAVGDAPPPPPRRRRRDPARRGRRAGRWRAAAARG